MQSLNAANPNVPLFVTGGEPDGIWYDTRNIAIKAPYLFCRTYYELVINVEIHLLDESPHVEPVWFVFYLRLNETKPWTALLVSTYFFFRRLKIIYVKELALPCFVIQ